MQDNIFQLPTRAPTSSLEPASDEAQANIQTLPVDPTEELDRTSEIMRAAVTYTSLNSAYNGAWIAEHTGDSTVADIVTAGMLCRRDAKLRKLTRLVNKTSEVRVVELWSLASVARVVMDQNGDEHSGGNLEPFEVAFLRSLFRLVARDCASREGHQ